MAHALASSSLSPFQNRTTNHLLPGSDQFSSTHVHHPTFANMSYPSFGEAGAQPQQPAQEHGGFGATGGPDQQQNPMGQQMDQQQMNQQMGQQQMGGQQMGQQQMGQQQMGQQMDQSQPQGQFQGAPTSGTPGAQGGQPQEGKTTLW